VMVPGRILLLNKCLDLLAGFPHFSRNSSANMEKLGSLKVVLAGF